MRPRPSEVVRGIRRVLADVVAPDLQSEYARLRVREIRTVLAQVDWDEIALTYLRETQELSALADDVIRWTSAAGARRSHFAAVADADLTGGSWAPGTVPTFDALDKLRVTLDGLLVSVLPALVEWVDAHPDDVEGAAFLERLRQAYTGTA